MCRSLFVNMRWKNRLMAKVFTALPSLAESWGRKSKESGGEVPWAVPVKALKDAKVALVTTGGVHLKGDQPFDMADPDGDPSWREVPTDAPADACTITHDYFNHVDADKDLNLVFPAERLRELHERGVIGALCKTAYSFMGHIEGEHFETLRTRTAAEVAARLREAEVDYALLVPA
jgi:D-proline reductase (dithiol) PrdB